MHNNLVSSAKTPEKLQMSASLKLIKFQGTFIGGTINGVSIHEMCNCCLTGKTGFHSSVDIDF